MNNRDSSATWREFERLISRIEASLSDPAVRVCSPDRVPDLQTHELREVDASIRRRVGSIDVLVTLECRHRSSVQDVTWIEQLATKKRKIGAAATIAVSASGFSEPAIRTAENEGIFVRTLSDLNPDELSWIRLAFYEYIVEDFFISKAEIVPWDDAGSAQLIFAASTGTASPPWQEYPLFQKKSDGTRYNIDYVIDLAESQGFDPYADAKEEQECRAVLRWQCHDRGVCIESTNGPIDVREILIDYKVASVRHVMKLRRFFRYSDPSGVLTEGVEMELPAVRGTIMFARDPATGQYSAIVEMPKCSPMVPPAVTRADDGTVNL